MATKYNTCKFIKQGLVHPNILFTAAYLVFSAEVCTSSSKHRSRNGIGNGYVATPKVKQINKIEEIIDSEGEKLRDDENRLDSVVSIDPSEDDALLDTDTPDTDIPTFPIEPLEQSVVQDKVKASPEPSGQSVVQNETKTSLVGTISSLKRQNDSNCVMDLSRGNTDGIDSSLPTSSQGPSCLMSFNNQGDYFTQPPILPIKSMKDNTHGMPDSNWEKEKDKHTDGAPLPPPVEDHTLTSSNWEEDGNRHNEINGNSINEPKPNDPVSLRDRIGNNVIFNQRKGVFGRSNDGSDHESGSESGDEFEFSDLEDSELDKNQLENESNIKKIKALNQEQQRNLDRIAGKLYTMQLDPDHKNHVCYDGTDNPIEWTS
ncbi:hypothetical protein ACRRVB_04060 [Candidatus Cardinium hertigii]|uniref:hypothetical protein n=1 Tax=Candidatus Cardinium hertigii TaxID=247481 RepID=UPI003D7C8E1D